SVMGMKRCAPSGAFDSLLARCAPSSLPQGLRKFMRAKVAWGHDIMVSDWRGVPHLRPSAGEWSTCVGSHLVSPRLSLGCLNYSDDAGLADRYIVVECVGRITGMLVIVVDQGQCLR